MQSIRQWFARLQAQHQVKELAREAFQREHPQSHIAWTAIRAEEADRYVIGVYHGRTRPPSYAFYAVTKNDVHVYTIENDDAYRPKAWR